MLIVPRAGVILGALRRTSRATRTRLLLLLFLGFLALNIIDVIQVKQSLLNESQKKIKNNSHGKIFITAIHWNNEDILKESWSHVVLDLAKALGPANVFVSVRGGGRTDDTKGALQQFNRSLEEAGVRRNIVLDTTTHAQEVDKPPGPAGWVDTPRGKRERRRIPYLAGLRNLTLKPLRKLKDQGHVFDKILFLGDVIFTVKDVQKLLGTNGGNYAAACSLDFSDPPLFYDTFALRDSEGHEYATQTWPYFRSRPSRRAIKYNTPVPVSSCWNGIVVMDAAPFYGESAIGFRGIPDGLAQSHLEGSECCLIHADNPLSRSKGVWLNPLVRVGYDKDAYDAVHGFRNPASWLSTYDIVTGLWKNRVSRWLTTDRLKLWVVKNRLAAWEDSSSDNSEAGQFCLINEMQVLDRRGWAHV